MFFGSVALALGIIGIFVPGLPTTPFVLLAAWLYVRGSQRLYQWLINHRVLGSYVRNFQHGVSRQVKVRAIATMWCMVLLSAFVFIPTWPIRGAVLLGGVIGTITMVRLKEPQE